MCVVKHPYLDIEGLEPVDEETLRILREAQEQMNQEPRRGGLRRPLQLGSGWQCPNCGRAHGPHVATCPEEPIGGSLRERLKSARA